MAFIKDRCPSRFHENNPHVPTGFSYQTGKVHSSWNDMDYHIKKKAELSGDNATLERDGDFRALKGTRYVRHCDSVQAKYSQCKHCGGVVC